MPKWLCVLAAFIAVSVASTRATVLIPADVSELTRDAIVIARGRVIATDPRLADDRRNVETTVTLVVESYLKGRFGQTLQFRVPGGELGRFRTIVVGAPEFAIDERIVVFLGARGPSVPYVLGLSQGVFRLADSADNSGLVVTPPPIFAPETGTVRLVRGDPTRRAMPIADFERRVRALVGAVK